MGMKRKILRTNTRMIQLIQLSKTTDSELMLDSGHYHNRELIRCATIMRSHQMRLQMETRKKILRTKTRTIQVIQSFKTMDSVPMLDSGPFIKRELSHMLRRNITIDIIMLSHLMRLLTETRKKISKTNMRTTQPIQLSKTTDSEQMPDFGLYHKRELINCTTIKRSLRMKSPMETRKKISRTKMRTILLILLFKTMDSVLMLDFGPFIKKELIPTPKENPNTDIESHLMRLQTEMKRKILRTNTRTIQPIQLFKTTDSELMLDSGPFTKDLPQDTSKTFNFQHLLMRLPTEIERKTCKLKTRETMTTLSFKTMASALMPSFSFKPTLLFI